MISKDTFVRRITEMGLADDRTMFREINANWDTAVRAADVLESEMPGIWNFL
jgi:hypothetical protein